VQHGVRSGVYGSFILLLAGCGGGGGGTPAPNVVATVDSVQGTAPLTVHLDASGSTDPRNQPLTQTWSFSDGTANASGAAVTHTFNNHGDQTATVTVSDGQTSATKTLTIKVAPAPPNIQALTILVGLLGPAQTSTSAQLNATDRENLALTYAIASPPSLGTAIIDSATGKITYTAPSSSNAATDSFTVKVSNVGASSTATVNVQLGSDPLLANQWHIINTGQDAFASTLPVAGNDMNVTGAWMAGFSGKGIKVGVVDTGLEATHEDLQANVDLQSSLNFLTGEHDPTPSGTGFDHGTSVAGIIAAVAFNGKGGRGVAYNATLRGYNLIAPGAFSVANMSKAFGGSTESVDNDLFNASFGPSTNALPQFSGAFQEITDRTLLQLRGGLGAAIVNAAGNDFQDFEGASSPLCANARQFGVSCGDPVTDERRGGYAPLIVGALNAKGTHASYSNTGSALWISAPAGEYGLNSAYISGASNYDPAIITTSRTGCANTAYGKPVNGLDNMGANPLAPNCQYTAIMNGTSAATPNVAAVVAMMLEANPKLTIRDTKYILAKTAKHVDANFAGVASTKVIPNYSVVLEPGWTKNAGGFWFSNRYGFGAVDAAAAVSMAKSYTDYLPTLQTSTQKYQYLAPHPGTVPPQSIVGTSVSYSVSEPFQTVEFVVVYVNIISTPGLPCNQIELTSPSKTKSILLHAFNGFTNAQVPNTRFETNAFYGEPLNGTWTLRFLDFCAAQTTPTALSETDYQTLLFTGH